MYVGYEATYPFAFTIHSNIYETRPTWKKVCEINICFSITVKGLKCIRKNCIEKSIMLNFELQSNRNRTPNLFVLYLFTYIFTVCFLDCKWVIKTFSETTWNILFKLFLLFIHLSWLVNLCLLYLVVGSVNTPLKKRITEDDRMVNYYCLWFFTFEAVGFLSKYVFVFVLFLVCRAFR